MSRTQHEHFDVADIKLADSHKVIELTISYEEGGTSWFHGGYSERGVYLGAMPIEKNGFTRSFRMGGDVHLKERIADAGRYNRNQLATIAADLRANGEKSVYGEAYKRIIEAMAKRNNVTVATDEAEAFKVPDFMVGEKVTIKYDQESFEDQDGVIIAARPSGYDGITRYDVLIPEKLEMRSGMKAADFGLKIVSRCSQMANEDIDAVMAEYKAKVAENERIQAEAKAEDARTYNAELARLREAFPFAKREGSEHARAAANCKAELQRAYPGVAFSVKSSTYSGGDSLSVRWTNGPTREAVEQITQKYQDFSHMDNTDYVHTKNSPEHRAFRVHLGTCKYVRASRDVTPEAEAQVRAALGEPAAGDWGGPNSLGCVLDRSTIFGEFQRLETGEDGKTVAIFEENTAEAYGFDEPEPVESGGVSVTENAAKGGIEIRFTQKPDEGVRDALKRQGFKWSKFQKIWYAPANDRTRAFAYGLIGAAEPGPDAFDMAVEESLEGRSNSPFLLRTDRLNQ